MMLFRTMNLSIKDFSELENLLKTHQTQSGYLTPDQAAAYLNVSKSMIYKLGSLNIFPRYKPTQGLVYYKKEDLIQWIEKGRINDAETSVPSDEQIRKVLDKNATKSLNHK